MQKLDVKFVKPGMIIGKTILNNDGNVLLSEGMKMKEHYKDKLKDLGITEIVVQSKEIFDTQFKDIIKEENRIEAKRIVRETMNKVYLRREFSTEQISEMVSLILDDLLNNEELIVSLSDIRAVDDYTFSHSVNVCVLSLITGISMDYDMDQLKKLGIGAILHDIGKILVSQDILNKPGALTDSEFNEIKKHSQIGCDIIQKHPEIDVDSRQVVFQHHERVNGSGYPEGKKGKEIHEFARIVAIADVYDALTSDRIYKKKILPHDAIEYLVSMGNHDFDYSIVKKFILYVASYPMGTKVLLSSGIQGIVVGNDYNYPNRPKIRCILDENGKEIKNPIELELIEHPSITIVKVLENIG